MEKTASAFYIKINAQNFIARQFVGNFVFDSLLWFMLLRIIVRRKCANSSLHFWTSKWLVRNKYSISFELHNKVKCSPSVGRKTHFDREKKDEIFQIYLPFFRKKGKVPPKTDQIWIRIQTEHALHKSISINAIYTAMVKMYNSLVDEENTEKKNEAKSSAKKDEHCTEIEMANLSIDSIGSDSSVLDGRRSGVRFKINISAFIWNRVKPETEMYHRLPDSEHRQQNRKYHVLKRVVWSHILSREIARQRKDIPCKWIFKRAKVYVKGDKYVTVSGQCVTCDAKLEGFLRNKPDSPIKMIQFNFEAFDINNSEHQKNKIQRNVNVKGEKSLYLHGSGDSAIQIRGNMLRKSVGMFEAPIERVMSTNAIRCAKYRLIKTQQIDECPMKAIQILKLSCYDKWIRAIGQDPFYVMNGNTDQEILYKIYKKGNPATTIGCDATGNVVKKICKWFFIALVNLICD